MMNLWDFFKKKTKKLSSVSKNQKDFSQNSDLLDYKIGDRIGGDFQIKDIFGGFHRSGMGVVYLVESKRADVWRQL